MSVIVIKEEIGDNISYEFGNSKSLPTDGIFNLVTLGKLVVSLKLPLWKSA